MDYRLSQMLKKDHGTRRNWFASVNDGLRSSAAKVKTLRETQADMQAAVEEEIKAIRRDMAPARSRERSDVDLQPDAARRVRDRRLKERHAAIAEAKQLRAEMTNSVEALHRTLRAASLPTCSAPGLEGLMARNNQLLALQEARARVSVMEPDERAALLQLTDGQQEPELVYVLDEVLDRDLVRFEADPVPKALYEKYRASSDSASAVTKARAVAATMKATVATALESVRGARMAAEDKQLVTDFHTVSADVDKTIRQETELYRLETSSPGIAAA